MIQPSALSDDALYQLHTMYLHAMRACKTGMGKPSPKAQAKLRRYFRRQGQADVLALPPEAAAWFDSSVPDRELFSFLDGCRDQLQLRWRAESDAFETMIAPFPPEQQEAFRFLYDQEYWSPAVLRDGDAEILMEDGYAFRKYVILSEADGLPEDFQDFPVENPKLAFLEEENRFCFSCELLETEVSIPISLTFSHVSIRTDVFDCTEAFPADLRPWDGLASLAYSLCEKSLIPGIELNPAEAALLPLCRELSVLKYWMNYDVRQNLRFPLLKAMAETYGHKKACRLLRRLEETPPFSKKLGAAARRTMAELNRLNCAPMWQEIREKLRASQAEYPKKAETRCPPELLRKTRAAVTQWMHRNGYAGTYPDFVKTGPVRGLHLENAYGAAYFLWNEKRGQFHIHCQELVPTDRCLTVQFLCGTALLRKNEPPCQVFSCMFQGNGRRYWHIVNCRIPVDGKLNRPELERHAAVAAKQAELKPLTKAEKARFVHRGTPGWKWFLPFFLLAGGFFALLFPLCMILVGTLLGLIFGHPDIIPMIIRYPWWKTILFCWISFGIISGLMAVFSLRK